MEDERSLPLFSPTRIIYYEVKLRHLLNVQKIIIKTLQDVKKT